LGFSLRNGQARSEKSGRAVGVQGCVVLLQLSVLPKALQLARDGYALVRCEHAVFTPELLAYVEPTNLQ
jgi:hypothetical protein